MLPKSQRLNLKKDFKWVAAGQKKDTSSFKLMWKLSDQAFPRVGIALNSTSFKKAVERNRARRLTSTAIQNLYPSLHKNLNLVIMPKPGILEKSPLELEQELKDVKDLYNSH